MWKSKVGAAGVIAVGCSLRDRGCSLRDRALKAGRAPESGRRADEARPGPNGVPSPVCLTVGGPRRESAECGARRRADVAPPPGARFGSRHACTPPTRTQPAPDPRPDGARFERARSRRPSRACALVRPRRERGAGGLRPVRTSGRDVGPRARMPYRPSRRGPIPLAWPRLPAPGPDRTADLGPGVVANAVSRERCDSELLQTTGHVFVNLSKKPYEGEPRLLDQSSRYMRPTRALHHAVWRCG